MTGSHGGLSFSRSRQAMAGRKPERYNHVKSVIDGNKGVGGPPIEWVMGGQRLRDWWSVTRNWRSGSKLLLLGDKINTIYKDMQLPPQEKLIWLQHYSIFL